MCCLNPNELIWGGVLGLYAINTFAHVHTKAFRHSATINLVIKPPYASNAFCYRFVFLFFFITI